MAIYVVNVIIDQGADFQQTFDLDSETNDDPLDLTGYTASVKLGTTLPVNFFTILP